MLSTGTGARSRAPHEPYLEAHHRPSSAHVQPHRRPITSSRFGWPAVPLQEMEDKVWKRIKEGALNTAVLQQKVSRLEKFTEQNRESS